MDVSTLLPYLQQSQLVTTLDAEHLQKIQPDKTKIHVSCQFYFQRVKKHWRDFFHVLGKKKNILGIQIWFLA